MLRGVMKYYKLTGPNVARMLRVADQTVRAWRCGSRPMPKSQLTRLLLLYPLTRRR